MVIVLIVMIVVIAVLLMLYNREVVINRELRTKATKGIFYNPTFIEAHEDGEVVLQISYDSGVKTVDWGSGQMTALPGHKYELDLVATDVTCAPEETQ